MMFIEIVQFEKIKYCKRLIAQLMFDIMIDKIFKLYHLGNKITRGDDLNCQYEKNEPFHLIKVHFSVIYPLDNNQLVMKKQLGTEEKSKSNNSTALLQSIQEGSLETKVNTISSHAISIALNLKPISYVYF